MDPRQFRHIEGETCVVTACLELVAFSAAGVADGAAGFLAFYEAFRRRFGDRIRLYQTNTMKHMRPATKDALDMIPFWFTDEASMREPLLGMDLHSGPAEDSAVPPAFEMMCSQVEGDEPNAFFRMVLPADWITTDPEPFLELMRDALKQFPLLSGYGGYSFFWRVLHVALNEKAGRITAPLLRRHPGFSYGNAMDLLDAALEGVVGVSWLTLLGPKYTEALGGADAIGDGVGPGVTVHRLEKDSVCLQAGMLPDAGDVNRQNNLPLYHQVGQFLSDLRVPDEVVEDMWIEGLEEDEMEEWIVRFFE